MPVLNSAHTGSPKSANVCLSDTVYPMNDWLSLGMCTFSHTANSDVYNVVKVAGITAGGKGLYSDNIHVYIPTTGKY